MKMLLNSLLLTGLATLSAQGALADTGSTTGLNEHGLAVEQINYDGPIQTRSFSVVKQYDVNNYPNYSYYTGCGQMTLRIIYGNAFGDQDIKKFECRVSVLSFDIAKREILAFIELEDGGFFKLNDATGALASSTPLARYLVSMKGAPVNYFAELQGDLEATGDQRIDSLAAALQALGVGNQIYGQQRFFEGKLTLKAKGPMKTDPLGVFPPATTGARHTTETTFSKDDMEINVTSPGTSAKLYTTLEVLQSAIPQTTQLLEQGYKSLQVNSNEANQRLFRDLIKANAPVIASELQQVLKMMRTENFHTMELFQFLNGFAATVDAIDVILKNGIGTEPGFMKIVTTKA